MALQIKVDSGFEGGNGVGSEVYSDGADIEIRQDAKSSWRQWFYFRIQSPRHAPLRLRITNAHAATYPEGWSHYRACVTEDGMTWLRADTEYRDGSLIIRHTPKTDTTWFSYFAPYGTKRLAAYLESTTKQPGVTVSQLGLSYERRPIECIEVGAGTSPVWVVARQHSGETMASWWVEGFVDRLLNCFDPAVSALLQQARVHVVPLVNVDGAVRGHLRGNAAGVDLNRQWRAPDQQTAPEVAAILKRMKATGVAMVLDVHGDETLPHVFVDGCDRDLHATSHQVQGVARFKAALLDANAAFQTAIGYPISYGGAEASGMCARAVARHFDAIGVTIEMPFKDSLEAPDLRQGWSPNSSRQLGHDCVAALAASVFG